NVRTEGIVAARSVGTRGSELWIIDRYRASSVEAMRRICHHACVLEHCGVMSRSPLHLLRCALLVVLVALVPSAVQAQETDGDRPSGGLDQIQLEIEESEQALEEITEKLEELDRDREKLAEDIEGVRASKARTANAIVRNLRTVERLDERISRDRKRVQALREMLANRAIAAFVSGTPDFAESVLDPDAADDADDIFIYMTPLNESDDQLAERTEKESARCRRVRRRQRVARLDLEGKRAKLDGP